MKPNSLRFQVVKGGTIRGRSVRAIQKHEKDESDTIASAMHRDAFWIRARSEYEICSQCPFPECRPYASDCPRQANDEEERRQEP